MRVLKILSTVAILGFMPQSVNADEFGKRFSGRTPAGLKEYTAPATQTDDIAQEENLAEELQKIAPAAGEVASEDLKSPENPAKVEW